MGLIHCLSLAKTASPYAPLSIIPCRLRPRLHRRHGRGGKLDYQVDIFLSSGRTLFHSYVVAAKRMFSLRKKHILLVFSLERYIVRFLHI